MGVYFKPLRRKFGALVLVMACVSTMGWVRGKLFVDRIFFWSDGWTQHCCFSCPIGICWQRLEVEKGNPTTRVGMRSLTVEYYLAEHVKWLFDIDWMKESDWQWLGFGAVEYGVSTVPPTAPHVEQYRIWIVPYWSIVAPLTLLSAWLLLSTARKRRSPSEPLPNTAAS